MRLAGAACLAWALLAAGDPAAAQGPVGPFDERLRACLECHGASGSSVRAETPSLGGQPAFFVMTQLFLLRDGRRPSPEMVAFAKGMTDDDLRGFSQAISKLPAPGPAPGAPDPDRMRRARGLSDANHCGVCHNPDFSGREQMSRLAGQREDYLLKAMRDFKAGRRIGYGAAMTSELSRLSDADLQDLAYFLSRVAPSTGSGSQPPAK